jgi:hypothetical protein
MKIQRVRRLTTSLSNRLLRRSQHPIGAEAQAAYQGVEGHWLDSTLMTMGADRGRPYLLRSLLLLSLVKLTLLIWCTTLFFPRKSLLPSMTVLFS